MNQLLIRKNKLIYNGETFKINDLFTNELYRYSNDNVQKYKSNIPVVNEVYLNRVQPAMALILFIRRNQIELVEVEEIDDLLYPIIVDTARTCDVQVVGTRKFLNYKKVLMGHFYIIVSTLFLLWRMILIPHSDKLTAVNEKFSIIRTPAAQQKLAFLSDINIQFEDLYSTKTVYKYFSRTERLSWVLKSWLRAYSEIESYVDLVKGKIGKESAADAFNYYSKRVVHTLLYSNLLDRFFSINQRNTFYTGNNLDRFAIIEERTAKKYNINTVCIPHGLEYGFTLPHCFTGDIFYTTSEKSARHLNFLYNTDKFLFDLDIAQQMFAVQYKEIKKQSIVFFTEPREVYVNLKVIDELLPLMSKRGMRLSIKLHPKDKRSDYIKYEKSLNFIEDFNEAISYNICFSRKSTILIEAVYNGSKAGAILINPKDKAVFNTFPSLQDDNINVFNSTSDLFKWLYSEYLKENY